MFHDVLSLETERSHVCSYAVLGMGVTPQDSLPAHAPETIIKTAFRRRQERELTESALTEHRKQAPHALANVKSENQVRDPVKRPQPGRWGVISQRLPNSSKTIPKSARNRPAAH